MASAADISRMEINWSKKMNDFEARLKSASTTNSPNLSQLAEEFQTFKEVVSNMLTLLREQVSECTKIIDRLDMRQRQKVLLFHGILEGPNQDVQQEVLTLIGDKMAIPHVTSASFKRCHRLGISGSEKSVLVHFHEHHVKSEVWKSKSKLKGTSVTVAEFLTRLGQPVYKRARKHFEIRNVRSLDGVINIKIPGGGRETIVTEEEFDALVGKFPEVELQKCSPPPKTTLTKISQQEKRHNQQQSDELKRSRRGLKKA